MNGIERTIPIFSFYSRSFFCQGLFKVVDVFSHITIYILLLHRIAISSGKKIRSDDLENLSFINLSLYFIGIIVLIESLTTNVNKDGCHFFICHIINDLF